MYTVTYHRSTRAGRPYDKFMRNFFLDESKRLLFENRTVYTNGQSPGIAANMSMAIGYRATEWGSGPFKFLAEPWYCVDIQRDCMPVTTTVSRIAVALRTIHHCFPAGPVSRNSLPAEGKATILSLVPTAEVRSAGTMKIGNARLRPVKIILMINQPARGWSHPLNIGTK